MFDKHYENQGFSYSWDRVSKVVTVRLSEFELDVLKLLYPGRGVSFAIRSLIHRAYEQRVREAKS